MGYTMMHEHTTIDLSKIKNNQDCCLDCIEETIKEYRELYNKGVRRIVDVSNIGIGRDIDYINQVAQETNLEILASTGYYKEPFLPREVEELTIDELSQIMIDEITIGIGSGTKARIIGEIGSSHNKITPLEEKVFRAASRAHKITNVPITTHTTLGTCALEQIDIFKQEEIDLNRVIIGHVDLSGNEEYIEEILKQGVYVEFDTIGKLDYLSDESRADILSSLVNKGWEKKIVLSVDITRKSHLKYQGGIGYTYLFDVFIPMLIDRGVEESSIDIMLKDNPNKILG